MKRFLVWLLPIIVLLAGIPLLLIYKVTTIAKISGVIIVLLTTLAIRYWMFRSKNKRVYGERVKLTVNERYFLNEAMPYYKRMSGSEKKAFEERTGIILAVCSFDNFDHSDADKDDCLAAAGVIALLNKVIEQAEWKDCIIVFRENAASESALQENSEVIFLDPEVIRNALRNYSPGISGQFLSADYVGLLMK